MFHRLCLPLVLAAVVFGLTAGRVSAALITFEGIPATNILSGTPPANTILTNNFASLGVVFGKPGVSAGVAVEDSTNSFAPSSPVNSVVGLTAAGTITAFATDDIYFSFVVPGTSTPATTDLVSFTLGDAGGDFDDFIIHGFDLGGVEIFNLHTGNASRFPVTMSAAGINSVRVEFLSDPAGYSLDDLQFNTPVGAAAAVPEPTSFALLGLGLLGAAVARRRMRGK